MRFVSTEIAGAYVIELEPQCDERGWFARTWCEREFARYGIAAPPRQCSLSVNVKRGTLRGMHYQAESHAETKLVTCVRGAIYDVIVDLRSGSPSYKRYVAVELTADNRRRLYIPAGCAHGFQTLADDTEVHYQMSEFYDPESARGVRWDDPAFGIVWPAAPDRIISARDRSYPDFAA